MQERNFLVAAIIIEFVVSINFYIFRAVYVDRLSAQVLFLCLFVRSQLTNTVTLGLVFLPKLLHPQKKVGGQSIDSCLLIMTVYLGKQNAAYYDSIT